MDRQPNAPVQEGEGIVGIKREQSGVRGGPGAGAPCATRVVRVDLICARRSMAPRIVR